MNDQEVSEFLLLSNNVAGLFPQDIVIDDLLAKGGQGVVYKGTVLNADAAIKIYYPGQVQIRIDREIEALSAFDNTHIVSLLWAGNVAIEDYVLPAVATTLIPGTTLDEHIKAGPLTHEEIGYIAYDISDAIQTMWHDRVVHRDLKPPNIMIKPDRRACVIDLGVARHINRTNLTATGATWGTYGYMSPEQTRALRMLSCKSDVFALGVILVECAIGKHPTRKDQLRLLSMGLHNRLPQEIASWKHASILKNMLHPRNTKRPTPQDLLKYFEEYAPV